MKMHYQYGCRRGFGRKVGGFDSTCTTDRMPEVTCKTCMKIITQKGLRYKSEFPPQPTFVVEPYGRWKIRGEDAHGLAFVCPVCGKRNVHTGGRANKPGRADGHRWSHCRCWPDGYEIRENVSYQTDETP